MDFIMEPMENNKQIAKHFLELVITGKIDEAYEKYVDMKGKHHNMFFPSGFHALRDAMKENHVKFPNKQFVIKNALCEGELMAVHSHLVLSSGEQEMSVVHLFRFENGKIVEMWDCGQVIPKDMINKDGAF
jgi:predicted SnoaL-like aldol condensation-catalyzing enzyme